MAGNEIRVHEKQEADQNGEPTKTGRQFIPPVEIFETENAVTVLAEMPGVGKEDVDVRLEEGILTIQGTVPEQQHKEDRILLQEYETGHYIRRFTISETIDQQKIEAKMADGILNLVLPKQEPAKPRRIEVTSG